MKMAFVMDPLSGVKAYKDTTYYIMLAAAKKGWQVFHLDQTDLWLVGGTLWARVAEVEVREDVKRPFLISPTQTVTMAEMDVVWIRTDPPFDRRYFYTTLLLDLLPSSTRVLNRPSGLRNWNEKLATHFFSEFMPESLVTENAVQIKEFLLRLGKITLKPIDGHGGRGILFLERDGANLDQLIEMVTRGGRHRVIAQAYVEEARNGDKRILLLEGEPLGAILRVHQEGKELNNLDAGGTAHPTVLSPQDLKVCEALKPGLLREGIFFAGIDMLGDRLIEINVTSPTGLRELCDFNRRDYHLEIVKRLA